MIINISDRKDTKFLLYSNTLSVEIKFHWQIIAFFLLYRWHSYINNVSLFYIRGNIATFLSFKVQVIDIMRFTNTEVVLVYNQLKSLTV